jgi:CRP-like cAMP-binding protein
LLSIPVPSPQVPHAPVEVEPAREPPADTARSAAAADAPQDDEITVVPVSSPPDVAEVTAPAGPVCDLEGVLAFADVPEDVRRAFAAEAHVTVLDQGDEVRSFALAYVVSGAVDVAATMVDAASGRLTAGDVLRSRGTIQDGVPLRLIGVDAGIVATWPEAALNEVFRACPWVDEDLRAAADHVQAHAGVTIGPLGERLDGALRAEILGRLTMQRLLAGDVVVAAGVQIPGLLLVGIGELELLDGEKVADVVGAGEFLFPMEVLGAGAAPRTARAGAGGALVLFGDRALAQELLVTCPPLLELFAGM